ncbi:SMP-30/gluconolactonase/LRE family protein [Roseimarinus sediminis]|uniref:SMP-30/gluconolactonase/LRE family protein n=1 Tax=Roseimarinus sediminis TaxID=1610899 RepID=UPI003D251961
MKKVIFHIIVLTGIFNHAFAGIFDNLVPVEIATGMQFTEGPTWHPDGYVVFSDVSGNVIYKWSETGGLDTLVYPAENSNGIACAKTNDFVVCRHTAHDIARMDEQGNLTSIVSAYLGNRLNSPNDATLSYTGSIYFTDPGYGVSPDKKELSFQGLYCIPYNSKTPVLLDSTLISPNGLTFVSDWRTLYVNESSTNTVYSYFLRDETVIKDFSQDKKVFVKLDDAGEIDGLTADVYGNLFVAFGDGGIRVFDKEANQIGSVNFPKKVKVRNLCFGGKYQNLLFVTAGTSLYKIEIRYYNDLIAPGLLGIPTDHSVVFNAVSDKAISAFIAFGTSENELNQQTGTLSFQAGEPIEITIDGLKANTPYYYQLYYKRPGDIHFTASTKGNFITQRSKGEGFSFAVEADPHLDESSNYVTFRNMLQNASNLEPDFLIDLGDNFLTEKFPIVDEFYTEQRNLLYRHFWDKTCQSVPLFLVNGNHEGELRWRDEIFDMTTLMRKKYYPTPVPNDFYTGSDSVESVGLRENYYAWNWGDALFVVLDVYGYTYQRSSNPWCFTLGKKQYDWFAQTLKESNAKYKFVFAHQLVGGDDSGRGGSEFADFYEMGGKNADGTNGFSTNRPGWEKPLHQLMVENGVQIYFHGHDHFYAKQEKDGIIYQEVPQPSFPGYTSVNDAEIYGYKSGVILPNSGHLQVTVEGDSTRVDYIGAYHVDNEKKGLINGQIRHTYYVKPNGSNVSTVVKQNISEKFQAYVSNNSIILNAPSTMNAIISLIGSDGKNIGKLFDGDLIQGNNRMAFDHNLKKGIYLLVIQSGKKRNTIKIVI